MFRILAVSLFLFSNAQAKDFIITSGDITQHLNISPIYTRSDLGVSVIAVTPEQKMEISQHMHKNGKCGGYELIELNQFKAFNAPFRPNEQKQLEKLFENMKPEAPFQSHLFKNKDMPEFSQSIADAVRNVSAGRLLEDVTWISSYPTRKHDSQYKNSHVNELQGRLQTLAAGRKDVRIDLISHSRTQQKSVRAIIRGTERPDEIVAMGAHFDSINQSFFQTDAPGADDDASGSANILEVFRLMMQQEAPKRSIHFFWYAAEEIGLVGSSQIAQEYKSSGKDVVSVLQLDMTLYPGSGKFTMGFMTDFTNPWLRSYLSELNRHYVKARILESRCGYGCSDHASWHRQGFAAAIPFESSMNQMNRQIHTVNDVIDSRYDFEHSAEFSRLALAYAMSLGNSAARPQ